MYRRTRADGLRFIGRPQSYEQVPSFDSRLVMLNPYKPESGMQLFGASNRSVGPALVPLDGATSFEPGLAHKRDTCDYFSRVVLPTFKGLHCPPSASSFSTRGCVIIRRYTVTNLRKYFSNLMKTPGSGPDLDAFKDDLNAKRGILTAFHWVSQRIAFLAASDARRLAHVQNARDLMDIPSLSSSQWIAFLPVFFAVLDPARIPHPDILEELAKHAKAQEDIACASVALDGIFRLGGQGDRGLFLWPRVWQWVEFIHTYREQLGEIELIPEITFYFDFIDFARTLQSQSDAFALMTETRGFWACIVQSWTFLAEERDGYPRDCSILLSNLGAFLGESGLRSHPERLEEMIDAAGSMDQLAGLVVEHIRTVINHPASDGQRPVEDLYRILSFVAAADQIPEESGHNCVGRPLGPLGAALYTRGCAEEVVEAIFFLCDSEDSAMNYVLHQCVMLLAGMILTSPVTLRHELLERGLLRALVTITLQYEAREWQWIYENVRFFLYYLLPTSLVYFRAVLAYRDALKEVQDLISGDDFKNTGLFGEWENFLASAEERLEALAEFQSASFKPQKACDNREVNRSFFLVEPFIYWLT
ncbi:hypothetical protein FB45DRAFT_1009316, partial [Roridomyces roridus]